jgi:AraC-like DNA-binding protein
VKQHKHREVYGDRSTLLAELPELGTDAPRVAASLGLATHTHGHAFEICYIVRGSVDWWAGDEIHHVSPGSIYLTRPDELHGSVDSMLHPCELYWLQIRFPVGRHLPGLSRADTAALAERLGAVRHRCFPGSPSVRRCFDRLIFEHCRPTAFSLAIARAALHTLLITVLRDHDIYDAQQATRSPVSPPIRRAIDWLDTHLCESITVEQLAEYAGLSVAQFHHRFRCEVGFTPGDWRIHHRIQRACHLLQQPGASITDIAFRCGFSTSQYFATAFKQRIGVTPSQYHRRITRAAR